MLTFNFQMNAQQLRTFANNFLNNNYDDLTEFSINPPRCNALIIIRALNDDLNIENEMYS